MNNRGPIPSNSFTSILTQAISELMSVDSKGFVITVAFIKGTTDTNSTTSHLMIPFTSNFTMFACLVLDNILTINPILFKSSGLTLS